MKDRWLGHQARFQFIKKGTHTQTHQTVEADGKVAVVTISNRRAEHLEVSLSTSTEVVVSSNTDALGAYTPVLSILSSISVIMPRFEAGFELRCFQLLSLTAWLPSSALSDNW